MTLKEALEVICKEMIPKEINGVVTEYELREYKSVLDIPCVDVVIRPVHLSSKHMTLKRIFNKEVNMLPDDISFNSSTWVFLNKEIQSLLINYIKKIIEYFDGKVVETRVCTFNPLSSNEGGARDMRNIESEFYRQMDKIIDKEDNK